MRADKLQMVGKGLNDLVDILNFDVRVHKNLSIIFKEKQYFFGKFSLDPSIYTMDHPDYIVYVDLWKIPLV